jgi:DNA-binding NarL/FixJ family response regulator
MVKLRVLVVDDTTLMRRGLKSLLEKRESVEFVGEATSATEATELVVQLQPDVILLDTDMSGLDTAEAIRLIKQSVPKVEIIALAETTEHQKAFRILEAGASGYVLKDINPDDLVRAIEAVCQGRTLMDPYVARQLVERLRVVVKENHKDSTHLSGLSSRELEILMEMTRGATDRQIAAKLFLSTATVKSHIHSIFGKIGVKNRTMAVAYVLQNGFVRRLS